MREDEEQVPESEQLDDSALDGVTGGVASTSAGSVSNPAGVALNLPKSSTPPVPPPPPEDDP